MRVAPSFREGFSDMEEVQGWHVATVKVSTSFRMGKRGKVPPRLETLGLYVSHLKMSEKRGSIRSE